MTAKNGGYFREGMEVPIDPEYPQKETMEVIQDGDIRKKVFQLLETVGISHGPIRLYWEPGKIKISLLRDNGPSFDMILKGQDSGGNPDYTGKGVNIQFNERARVSLLEQIRIYNDLVNGLQKTRLVKMSLHNLKDELSGDTTT